MTPAVSYSQGREQEFILGVFPEKMIGRFLDIGAWSATDKSNTRALYERGWLGVMFEPSPGPMRNLLAAYGNDKRIQLVSAAVSVSSELVARMHVSDDAVSTTEQKEFEKWRKDAHFEGNLIVPVMTVRDVIAHFGEFQFVSIDTEGTSVDIFEELLRLAQKPECISVEYNDRKSEAMSYAQRFRYRLIHENENNLIFQRNV